LSDKSKSGVVAIALILLLRLCPGPVHADGGQVATKSAPHAQSKASGAIDFKLSVMANGTTDDGVDVVLKTFDASDGKKLTESYIDFPSPARAARQLQLEVTLPGLKVLKREPNLDKHGNRIGERVLLQSDSAVPGQTILVLVKTAGEQYTELQSESLQDVLAFELRDPID
jgi:hypothetical protein